MIQIVYHKNTVCIY